jgi:hypothetical protein
VTSDSNEPAAPPFSPTVVEELLRQFDKTTRAHQLYLHNNPTYLKSLELLRSAFTAVWAETDTITLAVHESALLWFGQPVLQEASKSGDSIPWTLYKDGVRELTLTRGFEGAELEALLDIIPRARKATDQDDDLLMMLWEQEFACLTYRYVDLRDVDGVALDPSAEPGRWPANSGEVVGDPTTLVREARAEQGTSRQTGATGAGGAEGAAGSALGGGEALKSSPSASGIVNMADFDATLYFLDAGEIQYLRGEAEREYATDLRSTVLDALLDIFELQTDRAIREEVASNLDTLTLHLLAGRHLSGVTHLLGEVSTVAARSRDLPDDLRVRLESLPDRLSDPATLAELLQGMDESPVLPPQEELTALFAQLRPAALGTLFAWLERSENSRLRPLLQAAAERLASSNTGELVKLIGDPNRAVALESIRRAAGLGSAAAVPALARVLGEPDRELRLAAVGALVAIGTTGAVQALDKSLEDTDRDVRVAVIKALTVKAHRASLPRVTTIVKGKTIREADRTERLAVFELFGTICGDGGVATLDELLNPKGGLFGRKEDPELRACAALALGRVGTPRAQEALQRAMSEKDVVVRTAVNRALKGGQG